MDLNAQPSSARVSRRGLVHGALAVGAAASVAGPGLWTPASAALPTVTPVWSESLRQHYGVGVHPNFTKTSWAYVDAWMQRIATMNAAYIRGKYSPSVAQNDRTIELCRTYGLRWLMQVTPEDWSMSLSELRAVLAHIRDNAADVCIGIEGVNEPEHNRDGSPVRADWALATVAYQKVIKQFVDATPSMAHVAVVGPSLQMGGTDPYDAFQQLADAGLSSYMDAAGLHSYAAGAKPDTKVDLRLGWVRSAWGAVPTWVTETGYNNAMNAPMVGPRPVPQDVAATYGPRALLEYYLRGCKSARYEFLDDPDPANADPESNYGLVTCTGLDPSTWSVKQEYTTMKQLLGSLRDPAASFTPTPVPLQVTAPSTVKWVVVAKSTGAKTLFAYLNAQIWDVVKRTRLTVDPVDVTVTDAAGTRVVKVGPQVTAIPLR
jgi:hypothetical protein